MIGCLVILFFSLKLKINIIIDGSNPTARPIQPTEKVERSKSETEQALVPRGRNYFIVCLNGNY